MQLHGVAFVVLCVWVGSTKGSRKGPIKLPLTLRNNYVAPVVSKTVVERLSKPDMYHKIHYPIFGYYRIRNNG